MESLAEDQVYPLIGEEGFRRLVAHFYQGVAQDDILRPMYPEADLTGAEERLRDFLIFRFGGPTRYLEKRGHPRLRMRHAPFAIDQRARDRWVSLMDSALGKADLPAEAVALLQPFLRDVATFLMNRPG